GGGSMRAMLPEGFRLPFEIEDRIDPGLITAHAGYRWYLSCFAASGRPRSPMTRFTSNSGRSRDRLRPVMRIEPHVLTILCCTEQDLVSIKEVLHHGGTGAGQIAKIEVSQDRGSAGLVPFLRSPTRTVERASSPYRARTGDTEGHHERSVFCRHVCLARHRRCGSPTWDRIPDCE